MTLAAETALPKYLQVSERLIREISAGHLSPGDRLPPEREMAEAEGVSVGTIRRALADLEDKRLLRRVQGSGNYVERDRGRRGVYAFLRLEKPGGGGLPTAEVLSVSRRLAPGPFFIEGQRIRRLRRLDGIVVALEEIWLDAALAPRLEAAELADALYLFYARRLGLTIARIEDRVSVGTVPQWADAAFPLAAGAVSGHVGRPAWAATGRAVETSRTWFDPDRATYISREGPERP